ncbi:MAG: UbiA-like protein EboC [Balneolaceae bacterium]
MRQKLKAALELMRPANIVTAFADILAGFAAAGGVIYFSTGLPAASPTGLPWLLLSTFGLYGGGVVLNDLFDAKLDAEERPERPIPSGRITRAGGALLAILLLTTGILAATQVNVYAGWIAICITMSVVIYDSMAKHSAILGPLFMGLCRGGNLLLGVSIIPVVVTELWFLALIPVTYIGAITLISRGEVHGGSRATGFAALVSVVLVFATLGILAIIPYYNLVTALPFILLFGYMILPPFFRAATHPEAVRIRTAVKRGVLSLIILNSALTAGFAGLLPGIIVLLLLPLSLLLSRTFSVT